MNSPYIISGPVSGQQFYNRQELLQEITSGRHRAMYVIGGRQMGKTSLLQQIAELRPAIRLDVQFVAGNLQELYEDLVYEINKLRSTVNWLPINAELPGNDFFGVVRHIANAAESNHALIYLLIDESDGLINESEVNLTFWHRLRGLSQKCKGLRLVIAATRRLSKARALFREAQMSPVLDGFAPFFLTPFSERESANLLQAVNSGVPIQIPSELQAEIVRLSGGHPYFLQLLGYYLYRENHWREVSPDILNQIDDTASGLFANDFATFTQTERQILKLVSQQDEMPFADLQLSISEPRLPILLDGLVAHGYLRRFETGYTTGSVFLDRWLDRLSPKEWAEPSPVPEERAFDLVSKDEQIKDIQNLLAIHHQNLQRLREAEARYGFDRPLYLLNGIAHEEEQIEKLQAELENLRGT
ncbi:MAG: hypothetical protein U0401_31415 [Anaerolineae bacterium]